MKDAKISDAELEILETLWAAQEALNANEIRAHLNEKKDWERTTVLTLIRRLLDKGVIAQEKREVYYYMPLIARNDYVKEETKSFLNKFFKGEAKNLAAALIEDEDLSREDVEELREYFRGEFSVG
ncbi:MAG: BlaI/MecI/CopY family transcriptional regulator [Lachnospiraceae bacterium]|nr:BlaI/MecI/CopY family transcriptional regulator [Lachnospiraceae bacterium]